jgi:tetratricopeptide (TPR) repeat protein
MNSNCSKHAQDQNIRRWTFALVALCLCLTSASLCLQAKETSLNAIVVYQNASEWTYLQASGVLVNAKTEMRDCGGQQRIDKSIYGKLPKIHLSAPASLEVLDNGALRYTTENSSTCVVPDNIKFEKSASFTPAELAGKSSLDGSAAGSSLPAFKPGMLMVFVSAPDAEFAEFLRASRASQIPAWDGYLAKYPSAAHTKEAKVIFGKLLVTQSRAHLKRYQSSESVDSPAYSELQTARQLAVKANSILPSDPEIKSVNIDVGAATDAIVKKGTAELVSYQEALSAKTPGYGHLRTADHLLEELQGIDPQNPSVLKFEAGMAKETGTYEAAIRSSQKLVSSNHFDDALKAVTAYLAFLPEDPRIAAIVDSSYGSHFNKGKSLSESNNWAEASREFDIANTIKPSPEAASALANAKAELEKFNNKAAAETAIHQSMEFASQNDFISAYEVLDNLPPGQRSLADTERAELGPRYLASASQAAQQIQKAHDPIRGLADEKEIEKAYDYLNRSYAIDGQPAIKERRDDLGDKLSDYYLQQAERYISKPMGSGVCMGWSYLEKAMPYKASNLEMLRDEQTKTSATYQMRSRLSIRVEFRDQTSRRDSIGFAEQLADAIATGLENSGLPVRVVRPGDNTVVDANFRLVGDVVDHRKNGSTSSESKESKYRAGEEQVPNDQWNAANRDYEAAKLELESARSIVQGATARGKKKEIADAEEKVEAAEKKVNADLEKLDSITKTTVRDIIKPYSYTEKKLKLSATVELRYRILDSTGQIIETSQPISGSNAQTVTILENVKPEDTENVKVQGTMPDENEFLIDVENSTRDALIKAARASVQHLPEQILAHAQLLEREGNSDAAGENYILYLNSTPPLPTPERTQAELFLFQQFNIRQKYAASF